MRAFKIAASPPILQRDLTFQSRVSPSLLPSHRYKRSHDDARNLIYETSTIDYTFTPKSVPVQYCVTAEDQGPSTANSAYAPLVEPYMCRCLGSLAPPNTVVWSPMLQSELETEALYGIENNVKGVGAQIRSLMIYAASYPQIRRRVHTSPQHSIPTPRLQYSDDMGKCSRTFPEISRYQENEGRCPGLLPVGWVSQTVEAQKLCQAYTRASFGPP
ncbi:hypothetical protein EV363DRAFT_1270236 [Boletus edulis]|nr:hypothetical protein EV363DRAFT_1270236 [Boletus edulis]